MKKEPLSIIITKTLLAVIIFTGVGTIIVGGGLLIGKYGKISKPVELIQQQSIKEEITITTDKTEYEQWETVKITVRNSLGENVYHYENIYCYLEFKKENEVWIKSRAVNMPCLKGKMKEIKNNEIVYFDVNFAYDGHTHYFGKGKYRIAFNYKTEKNIAGGGIIYSNEFTIKEK